MKYSMSIEKSDLKSIIFDTLNTCTNLLSGTGLTTEDLGNIDLFDDDIMDLTKAAVNKILDMSDIKGGIGMDDLSIEYSQNETAVEIHVEVSFKLLMAIINTYENIIQNIAEIIADFTKDRADIVKERIQRMSETTKDSIKVLINEITLTIDPEKVMNSAWGIFDENSEDTKRIQKELEPMIQEYIENMFSDDGKEEDDCNYCDGPCCSGCNKGTVTESQGTVIINGGINFIAATESVKINEDKKMREQELEDKYAKASIDKNKEHTINMLKNCIDMVTNMKKKIDADANAELYKTLSLVDMYAHICIDIIESNTDYTSSRAFSDSLKKLEEYVQKAENLNIQ